MDYNGLGPLILESTDTYHIRLSELAEIIKKRCTLSVIYFLTRRDRHIRRVRIALLLVVVLSVECNPCIGEL